MNNTINISDHLLHNLDNKLWAKKIPKPSALIAYFNQDNGIKLTSYVEYPPKPTVEMKVYNTSLTSIVFKQGEDTLLFHLARLEFDTVGKRLIAYYKEGESK